MYRLTASYAHPGDAQALDALVSHYRDTHAGLAARLPDVRAFSWSACETSDGSQPPHALIAVLDWDDQATANASLGSEAGQAAVADLDNFAQAGVDLEFGEVRTVV